MVEISHVTADSFAAMAWSAGPLPRDACSSSTRSFPTAPRSCLSGARHGVRSRALPRISCDLAVFRWEFGWRFRGFNGVLGLGFPREVPCSMGFRTGFCIFYGNLGNLCGSSMVVWGLGWESSTLPTCKNKKRWPKIFPVSGSFWQACGWQFFSNFHKTPLCFPPVSWYDPCTRSTRSRLTLQKQLRLLQMMRDAALETNVGGFVLRWKGCVLWFWCWIRKVCKSWNFHNIGPIH